MARWLGRVGRFLLGAGVLMLLFVGYQLWGTGLVEARAQADLATEFDALKSAAAGPTGSSQDRAVVGANAEPSSTPPIETDPPAPVEAGSALARVQIPKIGVDKIVVEGITLGDLRRGPGHYPGTALPGQEGNVAIAGHRTTYGAPFFRLDELGPGDEILVETPSGEVRYVVSGTEVVPPSRVEVLNDFGDNRLTLTTCNPRYSAAERLIVTALLDPGQAEAIREVSPPEAQQGLSVEPPLSIDDNSDAAASRLPVVLWGLAAAFVGAAVWLIGRKWRRWPSYLLGAPVFLVVLFVFFEFLNRLLPPSV